MKLGYMDETKLRIVQLEKNGQIEQEKTAKESQKYQEIILNLEEEKKNLEKLLHEELEKFNESSVKNL